MYLRFSISSLLGVFISSNYRLTKLPQEMGCLPQLEYISCSYNHICSIDPSIGKLRHLRELKLASNKFKLFPEELFPLRGLQLIDLSKNHISHIPSGIGRMKVRIVELYKTRDISKAASCRLLTKNPTLIKISVGHYRAYRLQRHHLQ